MAHITVMETPIIFDRHAVRLHRDRACTTLGRIQPIVQAAADRLLDRLDDTTHRFSHALDIGGRGVTAPMLRARGLDVVATDLSPALCARETVPCVCMDEEWLPFGAATFDLVIANLSLHWVNDLPGTLVQIRNILRPDGLFLACMPILPTLAPLRQALAGAEHDLLGGASARVSPFPGLRDCAALLQRAGFALPVADSDVIPLAYRAPLALLQDLRDAGETNALDQRHRACPPAALFPAALARLPRDAQGNVAMPLHVAIMTGWAPAATQPKPLKPGQFTTSLKDALDAGT
ncbi:methyltransferase domain-containing protein [Gluconacetobacter entanii]|uniref:Methyltransferase domain-containing protein n=1 Tax=Gluconacetobacter entanii TaxID=108528 RepID=A0ABT3K4H6_9PROT|nr:methyltransferase domain-containing protein [Gluconacetobacter entanii]MCW4590315.1 methyltransferase domain-containing protein [Gluconacetobacter entanii]MCW4594656.1 methyltransferase domain-containing protein [Gluconacetobacter entanii]NPC89373.1 methyltransferase domain-containing protein [Gluconacetobacter entanii]